MSRRQVQQIYKIFKNVRILENGNYIWNDHEKYIKMSTNMPSIGLVICKFTEKELTLFQFRLHANTYGRVLQSVKGTCANDSS